MVVKKSPRDGAHGREVWGAIGEPLVHQQVRALSGGQKYYWNVCGCTIGLELCDRRRQGWVITIDEHDGGGVPVGVSHSLLGRRQFQDLEIDFWVGGGEVASNVFGLV